MDPIKLLKKVQNKHRIRNFIAASFILATGSFMIWLGATGTDITASQATNIALVVIGILFDLVGALISFIGFKKNAVIDLLQNNPNMIKQISFQVIQLRGMAPANNLVVTDINGRDHILNGSKKTFQELLPYLKSTLTHVEFK